MHLALQHVWKYIQEFDICCAGGTLTGRNITGHNLSTCEYLDLLYRAWQKNLHGYVKDDQHKAEIYKYLWLLLTEEDPDIFQKNLQTFISLWQEREPGFLNYFKAHYIQRTGKRNTIGCYEYVIHKTHIY